MPLEDGISLIEFAFEKEDEDRLYARWVGLAQYEISFDEFKRQLKPVKIDVEKTIADLDAMMEKTQWARVPVRSD